MNDDPSKEDLIARIKVLESKLAALEGSGSGDEHRTHALREISSGISHNLNNLLTGMLLQAELIETMATDPEIQECVQDIIHTGRRGADLVSRLGLALRENVPSVPHPIELKTAVEAAIENSRAFWEGESSLEGRKVTLQADIPDGLPPVLARQSELMDIVIDIIRNASDALPDGGTIQVKAHLTDNAIRLTFKDDGIGMDAETLSRATLPFFTTKNDVGSGLGLSTIDGLVHTWGGKLDIASTPGKGTTVVVDLPVPP